MIKGIIFDMDGVLINSEEFYFDRRMSFLDEKGIEPSTRNIKNYIGVTSQGIWDKLIMDDPVLKRKLQVEYEEYCQKHPISFLNAMNEGVAETIHELKRRDYKVAIASSSNMNAILKMKEECGLSSYIDYCISGEECIKSKPYPEIYNRAVRALNLEKKECIAVEDSTLGIEAAKAAGLYVLALEQKNYKIDQVRANEVIEKIDDVLGKIEYI